MKFCFLVALASSLFASADDITPRIGDIEVYGLHKLSPAKIRSSLGVKPGDLLPPPEATEQKIDAISGVVASRVQAICCDQGRMILYVGVEEKNTAHIEFHQEPAGNMALPGEIVDKYNALFDAVAKAVHAGNADEDLTNGYSLMADPDCRDIQQALLPLVAANLAVIDQVLRGSSDPQQRAIAAYVLQYGPRSVRAAETIGNALQYALQDPDEDVRKNAMTALKAVMVGARLHPGQQFHIEPTWFIELMNSTAWSDRTNATLALLSLTDTRQSETLSLIRERALASVIEMARWHDLKHALPPFILAGRLAGMNEKAIQEAWVSGDRETVLSRALKPERKHAGRTSPGHQD